MHCANCRAPLAPGSRFCNGCGAAVTAGPAPVGERTGAYQRPPNAPQPPHPGMAPTFQVPGNTPYYGAPDPMPAKKPIALLAAILALVAGGVVAGSLFLFQKSRTAVTAGQVAAVPQAPGLQQAPTQSLPQGPGVVTAPGTPQAPGQPVTGAPQTPKGDGLAPNVMMAPGSQAPTAPSVTQAPSVQAPAAPPVLSAPTQAPAPAPPVTGAAPRSQPKPQAPAQPQVVDNSDFDRYIRWLQFVEQERSGLRAQGETESFRMIESFYQTAMGLADPDSNDAVMQQQFDRNIQITLQRTVAAIRLFRQNIIRTKPAVPSDCKALDSYYMAAMEQEGLLTANLIDALTRKDIGRIKMLARGGTANIDRNLGQANLRLEQAYRGRGLNQQFRIETGGNSSMLGGLMGMGGL